MSKYERGNSPKDASTWSARKNGKLETQDPRIETFRTLAQSAKKLFDQKDTPLSDDAGTHLLRNTLLLSAACLTADDMNLQRMMEAVQKNKPRELNIKDPLVDGVVHSLHIQRDGVTMEGVLRGTFLNADGSTKPGVLAPYFTLLSDAIIVDNPDARTRLREGNSRSSAEVLANQIDFNANIAGALATFTPETRLIEKPNGKTDKLIASKTREFVDNYGKLKKAFQDTIFDPDSPDFEALTQKVDEYFDLPIDQAVRILGVITGTSAEDFIIARRKAKKLEPANPGFYGKFAGTIDAATEWMHAGATGKQIILDRELPVIFNDTNTGDYQTTESDIRGQINLIAKLTGITKFSLTTKGIVEGMEIPEGVDAEIDRDGTSIIQFSYNTAEGVRFFQAKFGKSQEGSATFDWTALADPIDMPVEKSKVLEASSQILTAIAEHYGNKPTNSNNQPEPNSMVQNLPNADLRKTHAQPHRPKHEKHLQRARIIEPSKHVMSLLNGLPAQDKDALIGTLKKFDGQSGLPRLDIPGLPGGPYYRLAHNGVSLALVRQGSSYEVVAAGSTKDIIKTLSRR